MVGISFLAVSFDVSKQFDLKITPYALGSQKVYLGASQTSRVLLLSKSSTTDVSPESTMQVESSKMLERQHHRNDVFSVNLEQT